MKLMICGKSGCGKSSVLDNLMGSDFDYLFFDEKWKLSDITSEYISEKNGVKLIVSGKIKQAGEAICYKV